MPLYSVRVPVAVMSTSDLARSQVYGHVQPMPGQIGNVGTQATPVLERLHSWQCFGIVWHRGSRHLSLYSDGGFVISIANVGSKLAICLQHLDGGSACYCCTVFGWWM